MLPGTQKIHPIYLTLQLLTIPLRFILIAPTVGYQGLIINHDLLVGSNEMFHNGTYDRNIAVGQHLARNWGTWAFFWNLGAWLFTGLLHPPLHIPITGVDVMITIGLSRATYTQRTYIPQSKNACHGTSSFLTERPPGVNESFFVAGARLNGTATTPTNLCKTFVEEWQYGVSLCFFYALLSFVGIVAFVGTVRHTKQQTLALGNAISGCFVVCGKCLLAMPQLLLLLLPCLLYHTPVFFFRHSPMRVKAPVRTARRYTVKTALGVEQKTEIALKELQTELAKRREDVGRYQGHQGSPTPLADFLGVYDMLIMVNMYLHYADVLALSSVSRSVRNSVLPAADLYRRLAIFKQYTCEDRQRSLCWTCPNQICAGCYQMPLVPQTPIVYHLESCIPYCKPCYYKHVAQAPPKKKQDKHRSVECKCAPKLDNKPSLYNRYINVLRKPRGTGQTREMLERGVCRECNKLTSEELAVKKSEAAKFMLKRGLKDNGEIWTMCARRGCQNRLGSGPRFWICLRRHCEKECTSSLHQAWGGNGKRAEGEVGDEAV